ncbi:unnamed protein product, partial [Laminaria digitata]
ISVQDTRAAHQRNSVIGDPALRSSLFTRLVPSGWDWSPLRRRLLSCADVSPYHPSRARLPSLAAFLFVATPSMQ